MPGDEFPADVPKSAPEPRTKTDPVRRRGGSGSGMPPSGKVALGTEWIHRDYPISAVNAFGIDFGETTTRVAGLDIGGLPFVLPEGIFPSAVEFIGRSTEESDGSRKFDRLRTKFRLCEDSGQVKIDFVLEAFFEHICARIHTCTGIRKPQVVLTVPGYYCSIERIRLAECAERAGMKVIGLINDYAAVAQSFSRSDKLRQGKMLVLSIGADAVSAAVMNVTAAVVTTLAVRSAAGIGGAHLIDVVSSHLARDCGSALDFSCSDAGEKSKWTSSVETILAKGSDSSDSQLIMHEQATGAVATASEDVLDAVSYALQESVGLVNGVMKEAKISRDTLSFVLLVGGIVNSPLVSKFLIRSIHGLHRLILNSDRSACFGAAIQAGVLRGLIQNAKLRDVLTQSVYSKSNDEVNNIVRAGTLVPCIGSAELFADATVEQYTVNGVGSAIAQVRATRALPCKLEVFINAEGVIERFSSDDIQNVISFEFSQKRQELHPIFAQYLYFVDHKFVLMNSENYEQIEVSEEQIGESAKFLKNGLEGIQVFGLPRRVQKVILPLIVELEVIEIRVAPESDETGSMSNAHLETGAVILVPAHVKVGQIIRVNTQQEKFDSIVLPEPKSTEEHQN